MSETPNIKENPFEQANGDSGKENLPFNRKKTPAGSSRCRCLTIHIHNSMETDIQLWSETVFMLFHLYKTSHHFSIQVKFMLLNVFKRCSS